MGQVVCLNLVFYGQTAQLGNQSPVAAHHALDHSGMSQVVEAPVLSVPLAGRVDQGQTGWLLLFLEALTQGHGQ